MSLVVWLNKRRYNLGRGDAQYAADVNVNGVNERIALRLRLHCSSMLWRIVMTGKYETEGGRDRREIWRGRIGKTGRDGHTP